MDLEFPDKNDFKNEEARRRSRTVGCECGTQALWVNFIPAPYTGCFLKITCPECGKFDVLFDDYS